MNILTPAVRAWIYGVALAALPLLIGYGVVSKEDAPLWIALIGAVLVPGLALANTPVGKHRADETGATNLILAIFLGVLLALIAWALITHLIA